MKRLTSAILILVASAMATAAEPEVGTKQSLVLAYQSGEETYTPTVNYASKESAERVLEKTLDAVSASLSVSLDDFAAFTIPADDAQ
ncbi:MAG: hypothetical protein R3221_05240 [Spongiibacter sp.]|uniref:Uncharacterized protein n=1 Tax=Spongiibacter thalassae TaxID=2721624 RepID=A0ABX1GIT1_9GAMM|nr:hypothetical protein [Spongiibacter thalassae]MDX1505097.1 hypothetical protein [Spongiibacter sp.]NKI18352.1 hypothetical protein [Spongiibacter thalassae]